MVAMTAVDVCERAGEQDGVPRGRPLHAAARQHLQPVPVPAPAATAATQQIASLLQSIEQQGLPRDERMVVLLSLWESWSCIRDDPHWSRSEPALAEQLLRVAEYLCDWRLCTELLVRMQQCAANATGLRHALQLARSHFKLGRLTEAQDCIWPLLLQHPAHASLLESHQRLQQAAQVVGPAAVRGVDDVLCLLPLEAHHLQDFYWQFDERIADLCNLPAFHCDDEWHYWLQCNQANRQRRLFALIDRQWGFVGSVCLEVHDSLGFFYYWLGADFQGLGLGPRAVTTLLEFGSRHLGMRSCYAKVYQHNTASRRAVEKIGFGLLPFTALPPSDNELFFYRGEAVAPLRHFRQLSQLLDALDSQIVLSAIHPV